MLMLKRKSWWWWAMVDSGNEILIIWELEEVLNMTEQVRAHVGHVTGGGEEAIFHVSSVEAKIKGEFG